MATDMDGAYCEWPHDGLADGDDPQGESTSGVLDQGSVSFGRFAAESLSWEKWSVFSHNRCQEELEKFKAPGLVAQKKAYFEEYYKKIRALKKLQEVQQDAHGLDSGGVGSHPTGVDRCSNGEVDYHQHIEEQTCESTDNCSTFLPKESESFSNERTHQNDQCMQNGEAVDAIITDVLEAYSLDPDLSASNVNESQSCVKDETLMENKPNGSLEDTIKGQHESSLSIVGPAIVTQEEIAQPQSPLNPFKNIKTTQGSNQLNKVELNIKRYKEQTSLKAAVSGRNTRNLGSFHKKAAAQSTNHQKLEHKPKLPSKVLKGPTGKANGTDSVKRKINVISRASKSASSQRVPIITPSPSLAALQKKIVPPKVESTLSMNSSLKTSKMVTRMSVRKEEPSRILNTSKVMPASSNVRKAAADNKRVLEEGARKPGMLNRHHTRVKRTAAADCRPSTISTGYGNISSQSKGRDFSLRRGSRAANEKELKDSSGVKEAEKKNQAKETEKSKMSVFSSNKKFTATPLPRFYKNMPSNPEQKQIPPSRPANLLSGSGKPRQPIRYWR